MDAKTSPMPGARPDRPHTEPLTTIELDRVIERLKQEPAWETGSRNAITLTKGRLRVVVVVLRAGTRLHEHRAHGPMTLQVVSGVLRAHVEERTDDLERGSVLVLESALEHDVEAITESAMLLTLVDPS